MRCESGISKDSSEGERNKDAAHTSNTVNIGMHTCGIVMVQSLCIGVNGNGFQVE